jgi:Rieske 2Fe-2S family protein
MTLKIVDEPIVVARDEAGGINAYSNMCVHRGVEVASGSGNAKEFACPYHGWLYNLKGELVGAPFMKEAEGFKASDCRLRSIRAETWGGWVFVNFDRNAAPLSEVIKDFADDYDLLQQQNCRMAFKIELEWDCNWKFLVENLMDVYHVNVLHAGTFGKHIDPAKFPATLRSRGGFSAFFDARPYTADGKSRFGKMPWLDRPETFASVGYFSPNFCMLARSDFVRPYVIWPLSATRSKSIAYILFPEDRFARPDFDELAADYDRFVRMVIEEDRPMLLTLQNITRSSLFEPGRMSSLEKPIHHMLNHNISTVLAGDRP